MGWFAPFYFLHVFTCKKKKDRSHIFKYGAGTLGEGGEAGWGKRHIGVVLFLEWSSQLVGRQARFDYLIIKIKSIDLSMPPNFSPPHPPPPAFPLLFQNEKEERRGGKRRGG